MIHISIFIITLLIAFISALELIAVINKPNRLTSMMISKQNNLLFHLGIAFILDFVWLFIIFITNFGFQPFLILVVAYIVQNISAAFVIYLYKYKNKIHFKSYVLMQLFGIMLELAGCLSMIPVLKQYL